MSRAPDKQADRRKQRRDERKRRLGEKKKFLADLAGADNLAARCRTFASGVEGDFFAMLQADEAAGNIEILDKNPSVYLTRARIEYQPDRKIFDRALGAPVWIETKGGYESPVWRIKRRLWKHYGPGLLRVYFKDYKNNRIVLIEELSGPGQGAQGDGSNGVQEV